MAAIAAHVAAMVVFLAGVAILVFRGAPSSRKRRNAALGEVLKRGGEFRERQKVAGATDFSWSIKVPPPAEKGGET
jgi:hypothetical protein